nr:putative F-box protein At3g58860 [Coffea arabica]
MAEENPKCFKASSFPQDDRNLSEKAALETNTEMAKHFRAGPDDDCQEDRLSALPDGVLCHILSFLPTKLAASTSILSTRWRYIFFGVPKLDLDDSLLVHPQTQDGGTGTHGVKKFTDFVIRLLKYSKSISAVSEFRLRFQKLAGQIVVFNSWICSVLPRNVQVLGIVVDRFSNRYRKVGSLSN